MPLYKFTAEFYMRAASRDEAEQTISEELGADGYERHIICEEVEDKGQEVEVDLVKV